MNREKIEGFIKDFWLSLVSIILVVSSTMFFTVPKIKEVITLRDEGKKQKQEINLLSQKIADLKTLSEADLVGSVLLVEEALPVEKDPFKSLSMSKKIFTDNEIFIESFKFASPVSSDSGKVGELSPVSINFSFIASLENFKKMITQVEKILPLTKIEGLKFGTLEASGSASALPSFSGKINVISFFAPLPKVEGKAEKPLPKISNTDRELIEKLKLYDRFQPEVSLEPGSSAVPVGKENPFNY